MAAGKAAKKWGMDYEELYCQGILVAYTVFKTWNPDNGEFKKYLYSSLVYTYQRMFNLEKRHKHDVLIDDNGNENPRIALGNSWDPERIYIFLETLNGLSKEAKEIVRILFDDPQHIIGEAGGLIPKKMRGSLVRKCLKLHGGRPSKWYKGLKELSYAIMQK